jgi:sodium transport system permease protein
MMRMLHAVGTVFAKELRDALRDRRTLIVVFMTSVLMGPLVLVMLSALVDKIEKQAESRELTVVGMDDAPTLRNYVLRQTWTAKAAPADWERLLKDSKLGEPVLVIGKDFEASLAHGEAPRVQLIYSSANGRAQSGVGRVTNLLQGFSQEQVGLRLIARGVAPSSLAVVRVDEHDIADAASRAAQITNMLSYFVLMAVMYGALNAALDTTAGERERGSLEPLLATPAARTALVIGKWGAVFAVGLLIAVLSCLSFLPAQKLLRSESLSAMFRFGAFEAAWFIALLAPLAGAMSAVMMAIAIRCKTIKEAQANNTVVILAMSLMPMFTMFNQDGESPWHLWVPALGQTTLMNRVLKGDAPGWVDIAPGLLVAVVLCAAALAFVSRQLEKKGGS